MEKGKNEINHDATHIFRSTAELAGAASFEMHPLVKFKVKNPLSDVLRCPEKNAGWPSENQSVWRTLSFHRRRKNGDKLEAAEKEKIEAAAKELEEALKGDDKAA